MCDKKIAIGCHGTSFSNATSILKQGFRESVGEEHWYGDGVYFFVEGAETDIVNLAFKWGKDQAWDNDLKTYTYREVGVVQAEIRLDDDRLLDLCDIKGLMLFNKFRDENLSRIRKSGKVPTNKRYKDYDIFKIMKRALGIEFVKGNEYIRFGDMRRARTLSRIPNCTILAVSNPAQNIVQCSKSIVHSSTF